MFKENFNVALELLRKAESLTEEGDKYRAVTYNNFACIFRRTKKLRSALSYLEKALEIEYNYLHYSDESVDDCEDDDFYDPGEFSGDDGESGGDSGF